MIDLRRRSFLAAIVVLVAVGCAVHPGSSMSTVSGAPEVATTVAAAPAPEAPVTDTGSASAGSSRPTPQGGLPVGDPTAPMPAPGTCHVGQRNGQPLPDPACTPGAVNPAVTQATIATTICVTGWTATVRPPESKTGPMKKQSAASYGENVADGEYDHLVSLELGGAPDDPRNLWVEPGKIPNRKDAVENYLKRQVCAGRMTLGAAQAGIAGDWTQYLAAAGG